MFHPLPDVADQAALKPITVQLPIESPSTRSEPEEDARRALPRNADLPDPLEYPDQLLPWLATAYTEADIVEGGPLSPTTRRLLQDPNALRSQYVFWLDKQTVTWNPLCDSKRNVTDASVYASIPTDILNGLQFNPTVLCKDSITQADYCDASGGFLMLQTAPDALCEQPTTTPPPVDSTALPVWQIVAIALCCLVAFTCLVRQHPAASSLKGRQSDVGRNIGNAPVCCYSRRRARPASRDSRPLRVCWRLYAISSPISPCM